ncbi:inner membrane protein YiaA [Alteromonas sp. CyTr2]|uniref:inner membrane protein YiaA n=1 Tax=Alteromonas sp. CyTr2 TaxID=2935039 RepID=UPI00248D9F70|nr:inner membrane protein YiaA [Alteromonas sp. CyTr2]
MQTQNKPTKAFRIASLAALVVGVAAYFIGLYNAPMALNEKGYYFTIMLFGLFSVVSLQKTVRDKMEGVPTTKAYFLASAVATASAIVLLVVGLLNAELLLSEKGFFGMAFILSLFAAITVQKNVRDSQTTDELRNTKSDTQSSATEHEDSPKVKAA